MNTNNTIAIAPTSEVSTARPLATLESLYAFKGESIAKVGDVTTEEAIRLGVSLVVKGEESKARGVYVLAAKANAMTTKEDAATFMLSLKSEIVSEARERALRSLPANANDKAKTIASQQGEAEGVRRFDNLGQTIRAAKWVLANPKKVADGVSVFTVQQANAYLEEPKAAEGKTVEPEKLELHKLVSGLLSKPGTSQAALKKAVAEKKEAIAKAAEEAKVVPDNRTPEQKKEAELVNRQRALLSRIANAVSEWEALVTEGVQPSDIRSQPVSRNPDGSVDKAQGTLADKVKALAAMAGLNIK